MPLNKKKTLPPKPKHTYKSTLLYRKKKIYGGQRFSRTVNPNKTFIDIVEVVCI